jgi:hypothetical protein
MRIEEGKRAGSKQGPFSCYQYRGEVQLKTSRWTRTNESGKLALNAIRDAFVFQFWWKSLLDGLQSTFTDNGKKENDPKKKSSR